MEREIEISGRILNVNIRKAMNIRNINVTISSDKPILITAPVFISDSRIYKFLHEKQNWIFQKVDHYANLPKPLENLSKTFFLGKEYEIVHEIKKGRSEIRLISDKMIVFTKGNSKFELKKVLLNWYKKHARLMINYSLKENNRSGRFRYNKVFIRGQKTRWGSCSHDKNLNFNWKLVMTPKEVLDYIVIHELVHLEEMNHSKRFWKKVEELCPDYKKHEKYLKTNGEKIIL